MVKVTHQMWTFERLEDGSVKITVPGGIGGAECPEVLIVDPKSWVSIVRSLTPVTIVIPGPEYSVIDKVSVGNRMMP